MLGIIIRRQSVVTVILICVLVQLFMNKWISNQLSDRSRIFLNENIGGLPIAIGSTTGNSPSRDNNTSTVVTNGYGKAEGGYDSLSEIVYNNKPRKPTTPSSKPPTASPRTNGLIWFLHFHKAGGNSFTFLAERNKEIKRELGNRQGHIF